MLTIDGVTAGYGDTTVLRDVSVSVPSGCVVALLGPNGAGKTTLLKVASGLIRPGSGSVRLDDVDLTGAAAADYARAGICHIPEGRGIFRSMTVRDNLLLQSAPGEEKEAIERAVDVFPRLGERLGQRAGTMSGGEQQMLAVTRAYLSNPQLVLLDEVSLGLAPIVVDEIFAFFGRLAERGTSLLIVEQYVQRALAIADFVFLLHQGRMAFAGETAEVDADEIFATYVGANVA
jgi:branched-chain amino acid transport system ATP-binding protein